MDWHRLWWKGGCDKWDIAVGRPVFRLEHNDGTHLIQPGQGGRNELLRDGIAIVQVRKGIVGQGLLGENKSYTIAG